MAHRWDDRSDDWQGRGMRGYGREDRDMGGRDDRGPSRNWSERDWRPVGDDRDWRMDERGARRMDWDPGNHGGLDHERGPGQRGGYGAAYGGSYGGDHGYGGRGYGGREAEGFGTGRVAGGSSMGGYGSADLGGAGYGMGGSALEDTRMGNGQRMGGRQGLGHRGKGPKGFARTDDRLREMVCERLSDDDNIDASDIDVQVAGGEVTLAGHVASRAERRAAEDSVEACSGVSHVQNNLRVRSATEALGQGQALAGQEAGQEVGQIGQNHRRTKET